MRIRRPLAVVGLIALSATSGAASSAEDATVKYSKSIAVARLDAHLPWLRLERWLRSGPPHLDNVSWEKSDNCGIQPEDREPVVDKRPLCVRFVFSRRAPGDPVDGSGFIKVGTLGQGITGPPQFWNVLVGAPIGGYTGSDRLADLPSLLTKASALPKADKEKLNYARDLDVHQLDPALPSMSLEKWLRSGPVGVKTLIWRTSPACDLKDPGPASADDNDYATCVQFILSTRGASESSPTVSLLGMIVVGTAGKGITGPPRLESFSIWYPRLRQRDSSWVPDYDDRKLSDLFRALSEISSH